MPYREIIACIYIISFTRYHQIYIGSTNNFHSRKNSHLNRLKLGKHHNKFLQRAYTKYNLENDISIEILEKVEDPSAILSREQFWINKYNAANPKYGFNMVPNVTSLGTRGLKLSEERKEQMSKNKIGIPGIGRNRSCPDQYNAKEYELYDPQGNLIKIKNLRFFCKENDLEYGPMLNLARDKHIEYKGWRKHLNRKHKQRLYAKVVSPEGKIFEIAGAAEFAREHGLESRSLISLCHKKIKTCKGWKLFDPNIDEDFYEKKGNLWKLISPTNEEFETENLKSFSLKNNFKRQTIVKTGHSNGWIIKGKEKFTLTSPAGIKYRIFKINLFSRISGISYKDLLKLASNIECKNLKGWILTKH